MTPRRAVLVVVVGAALGCLRPWEPSGPYRCDAEGACPSGFTCDDGLCCRPGGTPACPTLVVEGRCPSGQPPQRFYADRDGDGFGAGEPRLLCSQPRLGGVVPERLDGGRVVLDCDDGDAGLAVNPLAPERCNGVDDNCNGVVDEGLDAGRAWFRDVDGDGFGAEGERFVACGQPPGYAARAGDCDATAADVFPGAPERCNNRDDNCNGQSDDAPFIDAESPGGPRVDCAEGAGICSLGGVECRYDPGAMRSQRVCVPRAQPRSETCNGLDDDCDGETDDAPGCGGPASLTATPGVLTGAVRVAVPGARLPPGCLKGRAGEDAQSWFDPTWLGSKGYVEMAVPVRHTWYAEAAAGTTWDLSNRGSLSLALGDVTTLTGLGLPIFSDAFPGPIVTLCGPAGGVEYLRLTPATNRLVERGGVDGGGLRVSLSLEAAPTGWTREVSPGFSLAAISRVELTVVPNQSPDAGLFEVRTFTITVFPDAGFGP